ncbi:nucleoside hydrolase [Fontivita pretiosa]|uniref:nucleoside hydrolase n=1 Tax=Fontivita pretiosa TaxID=2989684 RepID=UPI003D170D49
MPRTLLIDTDTASDDAVALIMALRCPQVRVAAITVVSGNVPLPQGVANALYTAQLCGADVPVFAGCARPLLREPAHAQWFHGRDGLGDMNYPPPRIQARPQHAIDAIIDTIRTNPGIELATLGPLTNLALAILREPSIVQSVSRCIVMGGNPCCEGNVTPAAEYNIWCDPEAARIVLRSGLPIELVGWQLCRGQAVLREHEIEQFRALGTELARFCIDCNRTAMQAYRIQTGEIGIALPDPVAMAVALDPSIAIDKSDHLVEVETASELTRGMTVVDRLNVSGDERNRGAWGDPGQRRRTTVVWQIDVPRWKQLLRRAIE